MDAKDYMIRELVCHIEEFITNHPKENNETYIGVVKQAKKLIKEAVDAEKKSNKENKLAREREYIAQVQFENSDLDGLVCIETEHWESNGDIFTNIFYAENEEDPKGDSIKATFVVEFKKNSKKVLDSHVNCW